MTAEVPSSSSPATRRCCARRLCARSSRRLERGLDAAILSFRPPDPGDFGRIVRDARGAVRRIVEARNATPREAKIAEVNAGVYCFAPEALVRALSRLERDRTSGEFYLTDAVGI